MTVRMMRCTVPHHRLDTGAYVPEGTLLMESDVNVIPQFFVLVEYMEPVAPTAKKKTYMATIHGHDMAREALRLLQVDPDFIGSIVIECPEGERPTMTMYFDLDKMPDRPDRWTEDFVRARDAILAKVPGDG